MILLVLAWAFPAMGLKLGIAFLLFSFLIASLVVLEKHRKAYRKDELTRGIFIRNAVLEVSGTFLGMLLAAFVVKSLPLDMLRWVVLAVTIITAMVMLKAAFKKDQPKINNWQPEEIQPIG